MIAQERESLYFDDSRRLTGSNLFFAGTGAVLEAQGPAAFDAAVHAAWSQHVQALCAALGWPAPQTIVRPHRASTSLALSAPVDQLFTATEVNEWAWESATSATHPECQISNAFGDDTDDVGNFSQALERLKRKAAAERNPQLMSLLSAAHDAGLATYLDDNTLSVGGGHRSGSWPLAALPDAQVFARQRGELENIPVALVTGSNGKTTTVRLIAAMLTACDRRVGYTCTEGVYINAEQVLSGDYSGPAGARTVLGDHRVDVAVLETARGGMLRRGLAVEQAQVAVITNISADHFGEYGIDNVEDLARAKLIVAHAVAQSGVLVLNGEDPVLMRCFSQNAAKVAVFASVWQNENLQHALNAGASGCAVVAGHLQLSHAGEVTDLGEVANMPLAVGGAAAYNVANMAAAAVAAGVLGVPLEQIKAVLSRFGAAHTDNPGRLERWQIRGVQVVVDYAHNPAGLSALLKVAQSLIAKSGGRLGLLLGQAGNRENEDVQKLAAVAAAANPDQIVLKDIDGMLRGRAAGEIPALLEQSLRDAGFPMSRISTELNELAAAKRLVEWAREGDVVVLPIHTVATRTAIRERLDAQAHAA
jgi:cyanophycin synthetase